MGKCDKVSFRTIEEAHYRAIGINAHNRKKKLDVKLIAYKCSECGRYHLTSNSKKKGKGKYKKLVDFAKRVSMEAEYWINKLKK